MRLFTVSQRRLYLFILSQVPSVEQAEEILQNANVVILAKHSQFEAGTNFFAWAAKIATYEVLKFRQKRHRDRLRFSDEFVQAIAKDASERSEIHEDRRRALELCLKKLRNSDRELIEQRYAPGVSGKELAEQLGRPANSVYQSLGRIRRTLAECVKRTLNVEAVT
ncbi:sigma-70 family RNA polymerase sigma factor [Maioricimonas sp. JC845]|uniref:sigma-70 family RNA polymerase sigma factor n=1 Tax=Maioricimonas sp. JC845 TaxID=3232138 RepID=UPI00345ABB5B